MPQVRRQNLPRTLLQHLLDRIQQRKIPPDQLGLLADWLDTEPVVPAQRWFKRFPGMTVCGEGELIKTFLLPGQVAEGEELR
jgi:ribosomal protein S18 acetylase RimI-like enzyme